MGARVHVGVLALAQAGAVSLRGRECARSDGEEGGESKCDSGANTVSSFRTN
jgi:hypothetical protein